MFQEGLQEIRRKCTRKKKRDEDEREDKKWRQNLIHAFQEYEFKLIWSVLQRLAVINIISMADI